MNRPAWPAFCACDKLARKPGDLQDLIHLARCQAKRAAFPLGWRRVWSSYSLHSHTRTTTNAAGAIDT